MHDNKIHLKYINNPNRKTRINLLDLPLKNKIEIEVKDFTISILLKRIKLTRISLVRFQTLQINICHL